MTNKVQKNVSNDETKIAEAITAEGFYRFIVQMYKTITTSDTTCIHNLMADVLEKCKVLKENKVNLSEREITFLSRILSHSVKMGWTGEVDVAMFLIQHMLDNTLPSFDKDRTLFVGIYCSLWNCSLNQSFPSHMVMNMQANAVKCLIFAGDLQKAFDVLVKVSMVYDTNKSNLSQVETFYNQVLLTIQEHFERVLNISDNTVYKLNLVILKYSKCLFKLQKTNTFSKFIKNIVTLIEGKINVKLKIALKLSLKIADYAVTILSRKCSPDPLIELLENVKIIPKDDYCQLIFVDIFIHLLDMTQLAFVISDLITVKIFNAALIQFSSRFSKDEDIKAGSKLFDNIGKYVKECADMVTKSLEQGPVSVDDYCSSIHPIDVFINLRHPVNMKISIYNIGIHYCNIGVICFTNERYFITGKFLRQGIKYLVYYRNSISENEKASVTSQIRKKVRLVQDALRYSKAFVEAINFSCMYLGDVVQIQDVVSLWMKCKVAAYGENNHTFLNKSIKDIYEEYLEGPDAKETITNIYELLDKELLGIKHLKFDVSKYQLLVAESLSKSAEIKYKVTGLLGMSEALWQHHELSRNGETAVSYIKRASDVIQEFKQENTDEALWLEHSALVSFWTYLCHYQIMHQKAQNEVEAYETKIKEEKNRIVTDLGDEPLSEFHSLRLFNSRGLYAEHESILGHLESALRSMKVIAEKKITVEKIDCVLEMLIVIGHIFRLYLLTSLSVECFSVVLTIAKQHDIAYYWIKGMNEILITTPEVVNDDSVKELQEQLDDITEDNVADKLLAMCGISSYYLKNSRVPEGVKSLEKCLAHPFVQKNTMCSVSVEVVAINLASQYALLSNQNFTGEKSFRSCPFLAFYATRKSIALIHHMLESTTQSDMLWPFKAGWLHYMCSQWLGTVCSMSNDPRIGTAYVGQSLSMAQQQVLPLRVSKLYTLLTEYDVLCDEVQDSRIKLESLNEHIRIHHKTHRKSSGSIASEEIEEILLDNPNEGEDDDDGFEIKCNKELLSMSSGVVIGNEKRIDRLIQPDSNPMSPCVTKKEVVFPELTFEQFLNCGMCSSPALFEVVSDFCLLSAQISNHDCNFPHAIRCIQEAGKTVQRTKKLSILAVKKLFQSLGIYFASDKVDFSNGELPISVHADAQLRSMYHHAEILAINNNFKQAKNINYKALITANNHKTLPNTFWIARLLLQERTLQEALLKCEAKEDAVSKVEVSTNKTAVKIVKDLLKVSPESNLGKQKSKSKLPVRNIKTTVDPTQSLVSNMEALSLKPAAVTPVDGKTRRGDQATKEGLHSANYKTPENTTEALGLIANIADDKPKAQQSARQTRSRTAKENVEGSAKQKTPPNPASIKPSNLLRKNLRRL